MGFIASIFKIDDVLNDKKCNTVNIDGVTVISDVVYSESDPDTLKADLFIPSDSAKKNRVLINIHGGGWVSGDKKWRRGFSMLMCDNKTFVMNINYGLSPSFQYPYCIKNAFLALDWIVSHATEYNLDLDYIYLCGDSAGAQIAAFTASIINNPDELSKLGITRPECDIYGLLLFCGAYDMTKVLRNPLSASLCHEITGMKQREIKQYKFYSELNTFYHIDDTFPKTLIISALLDLFVKGQGDMLETILINRKIAHMHFTSNHLSTADHCFHLRYNQKDSKNSLNLAKAFLNGTILADK